LVWLHTARTHDHVTAARTEDIDTLLDIHPQAKVPVDTGYQGLDWPKTIQTRSPHHR
jgi:hypothetical protein